MINNARLVALTPIASLVLIEGGAVGQIARMLRERSAVGQSLWSWLAVSAALVLWFNYYRVITPQHLLPRITMAIGITLNLCIAATIVYFRYIAP